MCRSFSILWVILSFVAQSRADPISFRSETTAFKLSSGLELQANLLVPEKSSKKQFPLVFLFGGFKNAARVLGLVRPNRPVILASFDYPFGQRVKFNVWNSLRHAGKAKDTIRHTIEGIQQLQLHLAKRKDVDLGRVSIIGASFGAPFALIAAGQNQEFRGVAVVHGFGDVPAAISRQLQRKWLEPGSDSLIHKMGQVFCNLLGQIAWGYLGIPSPEESIQKLNRSQKVLVIQAKEDSYIPVSSQLALDAALKKSQAQVKRQLTPGGHLQPGKEKLMQEIFNQVNQWMIEEDLI